jgi:anti-sigma factor RsiW
MTAGAGEQERDEDLQQLDESELDLLAYLDGELEGERAAAVEARLRTDRAYAARLKAMQAIGDFLRGDADRLYAPAKVDAIVDDVLAKIRESSPGLADLIPLDRASQIAPPTSRLTRTKKNTVIWVAFGAVTAAAAAMVLWVGAHDPNKGVGPSASATTTAPAETVAVVKTATPPPSNPPVPVAESDQVEVEGLEVGSEATVIYTRGDEGSSPVVWITGRGEAK